MNIETLIHNCKVNATNDRSPNTARSYGNAIKLFLTFLNDRDIKHTDSHESITPALFTEFPGWLASQGYSRKTINVYLSGAKYLMDYMIINFMLELDYRESVRYQAAMHSAYKRREEKLPRFPKRDDVDRMLEAVRSMTDESPRKERNIAIVELLASSGCRNNEIVQLKVKDLDFTDRSMIVTGKGSKQRRAFFSSSAALAIKTYWSTRKNSDPLSPIFARHDKGAGHKQLKQITTATVRNVVKAITVIAGIDPVLFSPHYFRHAFAIKLLSETHDLALVQDLMGHATPTATRIYAKIYPDDLRDAHRSVFN